MNQMIKTTEKSFAKLNLALDVLFERDDGYRELSMIMQAIPLCDVVSISKTSGTEILVSCDKFHIPSGEKNIAYQAASVFMSELGEPFGIEISIEKNIPSGAGLAGGSANAASVLIGLNKLADFPFDVEKLAALGKSVGADVPFCIAAQLSGGEYCAIAEGIGEILTPITPLSDVNFVLVKPKISISTKWTFANLDISKISRRPNIELVVEGIAESDLAKIAQNTANVLEGVVAARYPLIEKLKNDMRNFGSRFCLMSGSGSTVFGVFDDKRKAYQAFEHFERTQDFAWIG